MNKTVNFIRRVVLPIVIIALVLYVYVGRARESGAADAVSQQVQSTYTYAGDSADNDSGGQDNEQSGGQASAAGDIVKGESYNDAESVAKYIDLYGELPPNYITKNEAEALGWDSRDGNLDEIAPGKSIGGDRFGNYEGKLPKGSWHECDINYTGGYRGAQRLIFSYDGEYYYTDDHYNTFTEIKVD